MGLAQRRATRVVALLALLMGLCLTPARGETPDPSASPAPADPAQTASYADLLTRVKASDPAVDFRALRMAYAQTPEFSPYPEDADMNLQKAMFEALDKKDYAQARQLAQQVLDSDFVSLDAHLVMYSAARGLRDEAATKFHDYVLNGLLGSILKNGDGKSQATAWTVISLPEEYSVLSLLGAEKLKQDLVTKDGHHYDTLTVRKRGTSGPERQLWFNVDVMFQWMDKNIK